LRADDTVADAGERFMATGAYAAVVFDGGRPIGVVTAHGLGTVSLSVELRDVMEYELVRVDPYADGPETLREYEHAAWSSISRRRPALRLQPAES
jgi:hypothetical protein